MWSMESLWFEISIVTFLFLAVNIIFGHFNERTPWWRKLAKYFVTLTIILIVSIYFGRAAAFCALALLFIPLIYVHGYLLPSKGINGWTGEPKSLYYEFRGWDKEKIQKTETEKQADSKNNS